MATALVNIAFGFGHAYLWFCVFWGLNGVLQVCCHFLGSFTAETHAVHLDCSHVVLSVHPGVHIAYLNKQPIHCMPTQELDTSHKIIPKPALFVDKAVLPTPGLAIYLSTTA